MSRFPLYIFKKVTTSKSTYEKSGFVPIFREELEKIGFIVGTDCLGSAAATIPADKSISKRYKPYNIVISACLDETFIDNGITKEYDISIIRSFSGKEISGNFSALEKIPLGVLIGIASNISKDPEIYNNLFLVAHNYSKFGYGGAKAAVDKINPLVYIRLGILEDSEKEFYGNGLVLIKEPYSNDRLLDYLYKVSINNGIYINKYYTHRIHEEIGYVATRQGGIPCASIEIPVVKNNREYYKARKKDILDSIEIISEFIRGSVMATDYLPGV